jgi:hypothetical protein
MIVAIETVCAEPNVAPRGVWHFTQSVFGQAITSDFENTRNLAVTALDVRPHARLSAFVATSLFPSVLGGRQCEPRTTGDEQYPAQRPRRHRTSQGIWELSGGFSLAQLLASCRGVRNYKVPAYRSPRSCARPTLIDAAPVTGRRPSRGRSSAPRARRGRLSTWQ